MRKVALITALVLSLASPCVWAGVVLFQKSTDTILLSNPTVLGAAATIEARILYTPTYNGGQDLYREWLSAVEDKHLAVRPVELAVELHDVGPTLYANTPVSLNTWHHVAAVYDGTSVSLYLDGVRVATAPASGLIANSGALPVFGGGLYELPIANSFIGYVDWFRMSNTARYAGASFAAPANQPANDANTVLLFHFDEEPGSSIAADQSSNGNHGALGAGAFGATPPVFTSDPLDTAPTDNLTLNLEGVGHILIVPYFSTQDGNVTALNIVNTDTVNGKAVKIRFRGASNSDDVYDFQVFLSPGDVWTAGIARAVDGRSRLDTTDRSCTLPQAVSGPFIIDRVATQATDRNAETREGYIEVLNMGDIYDGGAGTDARALYTATKHVNGVTPCTPAVLSALTRENSGSYLRRPTTGLMASWTIINTTRIVAYSGEATAIEARNASTGAAGTGNIVFWDQRSIAITGAAVTNNTADPILVGGFARAARYDLPDLSTPYTAGTSNPTVQAWELSNAVAVRQVVGEFFNLASIGGATDWVASFPTRRYFAAVRYAGSGAPAAVYNTDPLNVYFNPGNTEMGSVSGAGRSYQLCQKFGPNAVRFWDREETPRVTDNIVISPGTPTSLSLCGEVSVVGINGAGPAASATFGDLTRTDVSNGFVEGWGSITVPSVYGLPILARQFTRVKNTQTNVYYGLTYPARIVEPGLLAPVAAGP